MITQPDPSLAPQALKATARARISKCISNATEEFAVINAHIKQRAFMKPFRVAIVPMGQNIAQQVREGFMSPDPKLFAEALYNMGDWLERNEKRLSTSKKRLN